MIRLKRAYEKKDEDDGARILVDRLWPRGLSREAAGISLWAKELAPSEELRRWFGHKAERWREFRARYRAELASPDKSKLLEKIANMAAGQRVTLLYAAKDQDHNNAVVLKEFIEEKIKIGERG